LQNAGARSYPNTLRSSGYQRYGHKEGKWIHMLPHVHEIQFGYTYVLSCYGRGRFPLIVHIRGKKIPSKEIFVWILTLMELQSLMMD
jgi:hypothetical protein